MQTDVPAVLWPVLNLPASIYFVLATLLGLLLRDMGIHGADNPERNNPGWLAGSQALAGTRGFLALSSKPHWYCLASDLVQQTVQLPRSPIASKGMHVLCRDPCLAWGWPTLTAAAPAYCCAPGPNSPVIRTRMVLEDGDQIIDVLWDPGHTELSCQEIFPRKHVYFPLTRGKLGIYSIRLSYTPQTSFLKASRISSLLFSLHTCCLKAEPTSAYLWHFSPTEFS